MKCAVKLNQQRKLVDETKNQTVKFMMVAFALYLGDKRGWKPRRIKEAIGMIIRFAEIIAEEYTTYEESVIALREQYGIIVEEDGTMYFDENEILPEHRQA